MNDAGLSSYRFVCIMEIIDAVGKLYCATIKLFIFTSSHCHLPKGEVVVTHADLTLSVCSTDLMHLSSYTEGLLHMHIFRYEI